MTYLFPNGYGQNKTAFETHETGDERGLLEFALEDGKVIGFGVFGLNGQTADRKSNGGNLKEAADVWFDRID